MVRNAAYPGEFHAETIDKPGRVSTQHTVHVFGQFGHVHWMAKLIADSGDLLHRIAGLFQNE
ncbi:hypothetical protein BLM14_26700 (plasmid) [Phyllobacterium zundukense]|nr:hypothetical protein BLM14_26700 [Phyllobacterium zundukense]